jgi:NADH:ubiquinone oxidoreductase subunit E
MPWPAPGELESYLDDGVGWDGAHAYLCRVQARLHWVPRQALDLASAHYGVSYASLVERVSLTPFFSLEPRGDLVVELCRGWACREAGADAVLTALEVLSGLHCGQTRADGALSLVGVSCLGYCAVGPNARIGGRVCHQLSPDQAATLLQSPGTNVQKPKNP